MDAGPELRSREKLIKNPLLTLVALAGNLKPKACVSMGAE
jgi:hypothetical protein